DISVGGGEVRIELSRSLEVVHRLVSFAVYKSQIAQRHVGPRIAVIQISRTTRVLDRKTPITYYPPHVSRKEKDKRQHAVSSRIVWMMLSCLSQVINGYLGLLGVQLPKVPYGTCH